MQSLSADAFSSLLKSISDIITNLQSRTCDVLDPAYSTEIPKISIVSCQCKAFGYFLVLLISIATIPFLAPYLYALLFWLNFKFFKCFCFMFLSLNAVLPWHFLSQLDYHISTQLPSISQVVDKMWTHSLPRYIIKYL